MTASAGARRRNTPRASRAANPARGEHELVLGGTRYRLRPSHEALVAIEEATGVSTLALVRRGNAGELTYAALGAIAGELIRAGADEGDAITRAVDDERIGELIFESDDGLPAITARLTLCLLDAATGGRTASGEAKAAAA